MSEPDRARGITTLGRPMQGEGVSLRKPASPPLELGTIIVIGGGCYGSYYVRQLVRARVAGAITWRGVLVVDRNAACPVATAPREAGIEFVCSPWDEFLDGFLRAAGRLSAAAGGAQGQSIETAAPDTGVGDTIVPSPLMPHLLFDWLVGRARERFPDRRVTVRPLGTPPAVPWQRASPDGLAHYVSFAEWMCPINCIEPVRCPATRGARDWTMPAALVAHVASERAAGHVLEGPLVFHCTHRAFGVGMIDVRDVLLAERRIAETAEQRTADFLVGTVSHCHGALGILSIGP